MHGSFFCIWEVEKTLKNANLELKIGINGFKFFIWSCGMGHVAMITMGHVSQAHYVTHTITAIISAVTALFVVAKFKRLIAFLRLKGISK